MIGIKKNQRKINLSNRKIKGFYKENTKRINTKNGVATSVIYCKCCKLPVHIDSVYIGWDSDDDLDVSPMCEICFTIRNLETLSYEDSGTLIYAPDLEQSQVNSLALLVYYIKSECTEDHDMMDLVSDIEDLILKRAEALNSGLCVGASNPSIMCQFMFLMDKESYQRRNDIFSGIRLFPSEKLAAEQTAYLSTNILKRFHPMKWVGLIQHVNKLRESK